MLLILVTIMGAYISIALKALVSTVFIVALIRIQQEIEPYTEWMNNELELNEMVTGMFTIFCITAIQSEGSTVILINYLIIIAGKLANT